MLLKYDKFYEGFKITREVTVNEAFNEFIETIRECQTELRYSGRQFSESYSYSAQERKDAYDPDVDFKLVNDFMSKRGFNQETINRLAEEYGRDSFNIRIENINPSRCAPIDYYLYKITQETFYLQGYSWDNWSDDGDMTGDPLQNEYLIRFGYGWYNTKYGKLCIEQNLGSVNNFLSKVKEQIPTYLISLFTGKKGWQIISRTVETDAWIDNFLNMDGSLHAHLDDLYKLTKPYFNDFAPVDYEGFCDFVLRGIKNFEEEIGQKLNVTRLRDEIRISI